jgi:hypothetical protein
MPIYLQTTWVLKKDKSMQISFCFIIALLGSNNSLFPNIHSKGQQPLPVRTGCFMCLILILKITLVQGIINITTFHFAGGETEAQKHSLIFPRHKQWMIELDSNIGSCPFTSRPWTLHTLSNKRQRNLKGWVYPWLT